ncbi:MAG TPA: SPFH domain-containing protein, partial [Burkholderiaceae bacterium]
MNRKGKNAPAAVLSALLFLAGLLIGALGHESGILIGYVVPAAIFLLAFLVPIALLMAQQWEKAVVLRFGKLHAIEGPGLFFIVPFIDEVSTWVDQRIQVTGFNAEAALTRDTVPANVDAILFWQVHDAKRAALEITDYRDAILRVAQTSLREMIGSSLLTALLSDRKASDKLL